MESYTRHTRAVVAINGNLLGAVLGGFTAWAVWPSSAEWWGMGALSIGAGMFGFTCLMKAIGAIFSLHAKRRAIAAYMAKGGKPKSSTLATIGNLEDAGMIDA